MVVGISEENAIFKEKYEEIMAMFTMRFKENAILAGYYGDEVMEEVMPLATILVGDAIGQDALVTVGDAIGQDALVTVGDDLPEARAAMEWQEVEPKI